MDWEVGDAVRELAEAREVMALGEAQLEARPPSGSASMQKLAFIPSPPMPGPTQGMALLLWPLGTDQCPALPRVFIRQCKTHLPIA